MKDLKDDQGIKFIFPLIPHQKTVSTTVGSPFGARVRALLSGEEARFFPPRLVYSAYLVFADYTTIFHLIFFVSALIACTSSYTFACLNLFALIEQVPTMTYVLQVVRQNGRQMLLTISLAAMVAGPLPTPAPTLPSPQPGASRCWRIYNVWRPC